MEEAEALQEEHSVAMEARAWDESFKEDLGCMCLCGHQNLCELGGKECREVPKVLHIGSINGKQGLFRSRNKMKQ